MNLAEDEAIAGRRSGAERLYAAAQAHFETAIRIYPSYSLPIDGVAMIHSVHDRFDAADALYARAMKAWPGNYASLTNWGSLQWERARQLEARATSARRVGNLAEANELVRQANTDFREALERINQAISIMPSYAHAHLMRAMMLETHADDPGGAIVEFEEVLRLMPNHPQRSLIETEVRRIRLERLSGTQIAPRGELPPAKAK
jgi:Tfp pilus assembly protein PilF